MLVHCQDAVTGNALSGVKAEGIGDNGSPILAYSDANGDVDIGDYGWDARTLAFSKDGYDNLTFQNVLVPSYVSLQPSASFPWGIFAAFGVVGVVVIVALVAWRD